MSQSYFDAQDVTRGPSPLRRGGPATIGPAMLHDEYHQLREAARDVDRLIFQFVDPDFENENGWAVIDRLRELAR